MPRLQEAVSRLLAQVQALLMFRHFGGYFWYFCRTPCSITVSLYCDYVNLGSAFNAFMHSCIDVES